MPGRDLDLHDKYIYFQLVQRNYTHVHAAWNYAAKKKDPYRVTQVVPVAGNLPLADNHTREHHPGLNATVKLGRKHNGASDRMCTLLAPFVILSLTFRSRFDVDLARRHACGKESVGSVVLSLQRFSTGGKPFAA